MFNADKNLMEKWGPVLDHESAAPIQDNYKKAVTARLLENPGNCPTRRKSTSTRKFYF